MKPGHTIPVDKTAALVISKGEAPIQRMLASNESEDPIQIEWHGGKDLDVKVVGRLTILGRYKRSSGVSNNSRMHRWVCRCSCGVYVVRRVQGLIGNRASVSVHMCSRCEYIETLKTRIKP